MVREVINSTEYKQKVVNVLIEDKDQYNFMKRAQCIYSENKEHNSESKSK